MRPILLPLMIAFLLAGGPQAVPQVAWPGIDIVQVRVDPVTAGEMWQGVVVLENLSVRPRQAEVTILLEFQGQPARTAIAQDVRLEPGERRVLATAPFVIDAGQRMQVRARVEQETATR